MALITEKTKQPLVLGRQGENLARTMEFDISEWRTKYGDGTAQLLHQRHGDTEPYPAAIEQDGDVVRWTLTSADTACAEDGSLQLLYFVGEVLAKQCVFWTRVYESLGQSTGEVPEAAKAWVEQVLAEVAKVTGMTAKSVPLPAGSEPTAGYADGVLTIGIPLGGDVSETEIAQAVADYLAEHPIEETDPNVPDWAKQPRKPGYTADEVGALSAETLPEAINTALAQAKESGAFDGADGKDGADGAPGQDGGYYTPSVTQPDENTMRVSFAPSDSGMAAVQAVDVELPVGPAGADGKSAYQYAKEGGYTGTEEEFAAKLAEEAISVDDTLTQSGQAADAAVVGERLDSLSEEIANKGNPTDEQVSAAVSDWLEKNPDATTTVSDGSITEEKLHPDLVESLKNAGTKTSYKWFAKGQLRKPVRDFQGWAHGVQFDSELSVAVCMIISGEGSHSNKAPYYRATIDPATGYMSQYEEVKMYDAEGNELTDCGYFSSFNILSDGTYIMTDFYRRFFTSTDKGYTWNYSHTVTMENEADNCTIWGITELSNGRWIASNGGHDNSYGGTFWSDDEGKTWTRVVTTSVNTSGTGVSFPEGVTPFEAVFIEIGDGKVIQYARATNNGRTAAAVDGKPRSNKEPALFSVSDDYGETWTTFVPSASITDMTCCNGKVVIVGDTVHFLYCSRYLYTTDPTGKQRSGAVFYAKSTLENVYNDVWETPVVIDYGHWDAETAAVVTDIGYPSLWMDNLGNLNGVYYDSAESTGDNAAYNANWRYLFGSPAMNHFHVYDKGTGSKTISYSQEMVDALLAALKAECDANLLQVRTNLEKKIAQIIIENGGTLEDGELDATMYVLSGILAHFDFMSEDSYKTADDGTAYVDGTYNNFVRNGEPYTDDSGNLAIYGSNTALKKLVDGSFIDYNNWSELKDGFAIEMTHHNLGTGVDPLRINNAIIVGGAFVTMPCVLSDGTVSNVKLTTDTFMNRSANYHFVVNYTTSLMEIYVNGVKVISKVPSDFSADAVSFAIEELPSKHGIILCRMNGYSYTARLYGKTLSEEEVLNNYAYEKTYTGVLS